MDFTLFWFMLPVAILVGGIGTLSGIGGPALFAPIFLAALPLLGPGYTLPTVAAAIGASVMTGTFGFLSGYVGYRRKRLIDYKTVPRFVMIGAPAAVVGAALANLVPGQILRGAFAALLLVLGFVMLRGRTMVEREIVELAGEDTTRMSRPVHRIEAADGTVYQYREPRQGRTGYATALGGFLTGMLSTGIGETVMPQLTRANNVPFPVAAATSGLIATFVVGAAAATQIVLLTARGGAVAVPWHLVLYTVPGTFIGGQIGARLQGRWSQRAMERGIGILFLAIAAAMTAIAVI